MPEIAAANLTIRFDEQSWSLHNGQAPGAPPLLSARMGSLDLAPGFAAARRLPVQGTHFSAENVAMVVVGFASEDTSWHLGLLLQPEIAEARGGRWCSLARWTEAESVPAQQAGIALADVIGRPFRLVAPTTAPAPAAEEPAGTAQPEPDAPPAAPLPEPVRIALPLDLGDWTVQEAGTGLLIQRSKGWKRALLARGVFYLVLAPAFGLLSAGALISRYAPVQPAWLPLLGLVIAVALLIAGIWQFRARLRGPRIVIDERAQMIRMTNASGNRVLVQTPFEGVAHILVSHAVGRRQTQQGDSRGTRYAFSAETWIHAYSPRRGFIELCYVPETEGRARGDAPFKPARLLSLSDIDSPTHRAGLVIASQVGVPAYAEER